MRIPLPNERLQTGALPEFQAPNSSPVTSSTGSELQALGQSVQSLGQSGMAIADELQHSLNAANVKERVAQLADRTQNALWGPDGYMSTRGKAAMGYSRAKTLGELDKFQAELESGLDNDVQKGMFRDVAMQHLRTVREMVARHEGEQIIVNNAAQSDALSQTMADQAIEVYAQFGNRQPTIAEGTPVPAAVQDPQNPTAATPAVPPFKQLRDTAAEQIIERNKLLGRPDAVTAQDLQALDGRIAEGIVKRLLAQQRPAEARAFMASYSQRVPPAVATGLLSDVDRASKASDGAALWQKLQGEIASDLTKRAAASGPGPVPPPAPGDILAELIPRLQASGADQDVQQAAIATAQRDMAITREAQTMQAKTSFDDAVRWFLDPNNAGKGIKHPDFPPDLYRKLIDGGQWEAAARFGETGQLVSDPGTFLAATALYDTGRMRGMAMTELAARYRGNLSPHDWAAVDSMWRESNQARTSESSKILEREDMVKEFARRLNLLPRTGSDVQMKQALDSWPFYHFREQLMEQVQRQGETTNLHADFTKAFDALMEQKVHVGGLGGTEKVFAGLTQAEYEGDLSVPGPDNRPIYLQRAGRKTIPVDVEAALIAKLRSMNLPTDPTHIGQAWAASQFAQNLSELKTPSLIQQRSAATRDLIFGQQNATPPLRETNWTQKLSGEGPGNRHQ